MRRRLGVIGLAAVLGAAAGAVSMTTASAVTVPLDADFGVLLPGQSAEASTDIVVPAASVVTSAEWTTITGSGIWGARLCSDTLCTPLDDLEGAAVAAGTYRVVVDVTMPTDAAPTGATAGRGVIALMESSELPLTDGALALTGVTLPWIAMIAGATALGGGAALLLRRRKDDGEVGA